MLIAFVFAVSLNFLSGYLFVSWFTRKLKLSEYRSYPYYKGVLASPLFGMAAFLALASSTELWAIILGVLLNLLIPPLFLVFIWMTGIFFDSLKRRLEKFFH